MADITIPQLNAATSVSGTDVMVISQAGVTKKVEVDKLLAEVRSDLNEIEHEQIQGGVYDVSSHNDGAVFESLSNLLGSANLSTLIPTSVRHGGMSIRFIQSSDNKYVQYRLMSDTFNTTELNWQGVDDEPTVGSVNFVKSGGSAKMNCKNLAVTEKKSYSTLKVLDSSIKQEITIIGREGLIQDAYFKMHTGVSQYLQITRVRRNYNGGNMVQINLCSSSGDGGDNVLNFSKGYGVAISENLEYFEGSELNIVDEAKVLIDWSALEYFPDSSIDYKPSGHMFYDVVFSEHYGWIQMHNSIPRLETSISQNTTLINNIRNEIYSDSVLLPHTYLNPNNGAFGTNLENWTTSYMQVKGGSKCYFVDNNKSTSARWGIFLSFDGRYPINMVEGSTNQRESITVPSDNEFYWIAISVNRITESLCIQDNTTILGSIASLRNLIGSNGEEVLWLGTSIPAAGRYPENACDALGYKLYNMSLGASGICRDGMNGMLNTGYGGRSGLDLAETIEEKESRYRHLVTNGTINEEKLELWKTYGYEKRIIPYIDGTIARCSIIVFDHGYNDRAMMAKDVINWDSINKSIYRDDSSFNRIDSYTEAFCYLLKKIYAVNPNIKIVICSYLENQSEQVVRGGKDICNIQSKIADHFGFDFLPLYAHIGFFTNSYLPSTDTYMYFYNQEHGTSYPTYNWGGENPEGNVTRFQYYCPDGIHPHTDKTGRAESVLSKAMIKLLGSI